MNKGILVILLLFSSSALLIQSVDYGVRKHMTDNMDISNNAMCLVKQNTYSAFPGGAIITCGVPSVSNEIDIADFDNDGFYDIAIIGNDTRRVFICNYRGLRETFITPYNISSNVIFSDINNDGLYEIYHGFNNGASIIINSSYSINITLLGLGDSSFIRADIDGDSISEVIFANVSDVYKIEDPDFSYNKIYTSKSNIKFITTAGLLINEPEYIVVVTVNETIAINSSGATLWKNSYTSTVRPEVSDIDNDGLDEIILTNKTNIIVIDNNGDLIWKLDIANNIEGLAVEDVDGDGTGEIFAKSGGDLYKIENETTYSIVLTNIDTLPLFVNFDGDSIYEKLIFINQTLHIVFSNNTLKSLYPREFTVESIYIHATDLDNDGLVEVLSFHSYWGERKLFTYRLMKPRKTVKPSGGGVGVVSYNVSKYHKYSEIVQILEQLKQAFPNRVEIFTIGKSYNYSGTLDYDIIAVKITNGDNIEKPALLVVGAHHARELITAEAALYLAVNLTEQYGYDSIITEILDNFDVYIIPVLNIGGHEYAMFFEWQRKNLRPVDNDGDGLIDEDPPEDTNGDGYIDLIYVYNETTGTWSFYGYEGNDDDGDGRPSEDPYGGVDPNRNYNYSWTNKGRYADPMSETYSGPSPLSEPETQALDAFVSEILPIVAISLHSGEETIFYPWGTKYLIPFEYNLITELAYVAQLATGFGAMQSCSIYESHGVWDDHMYGFYGVLAFTPEIFVNFSWSKYFINNIGGKWYYHLYGVKWRFNPFPSHIKNVCENALNMFINVAVWASGIIRDSTPPVVEKVSITSYESRKFINIKTHDVDSGIHYIQINIFNETYNESKLMIHDMNTDSWNLTAYIFGDFTIEVVNRAGLKTVIGSNFIQILEPENGTYHNSASVTITWFVYDADKVDHYEIYVNGSFVTSVSNTTNYTINLASEGFFIINVSAFLTNGSVVYDFVRIYVDLTSPSIKILEPINNSIIMPPVTVSWSASDNMGIDHYEYSVDGGPWHSVGTSTSVEINIGSSGLHYITIRAVDLAGNYNTSTVYIRVDITAPQIQILSPENHSILLSNTVNISWSGYDDVELDHFDIKIDDEPWENVGLMYSYVVSLVSGKHTIIIRAYDKVGRYAEAKIIIFVDVEKPEITIIFPENNSIVGIGNITIRWNASDDLGIDHYEIRINDSSWVDIGNETNYSINLTEVGAYLIYIKAVDLAGRETVIILKIDVQYATTPQTATTPIQETTAAPIQVSQTMMSILIIMALLAMVLIIVAKRRKKYQ